MAKKRFVWNELAIRNIIDYWPTQSVEEIASSLGTTTATVYDMVKRIRQRDPSLLPKKPTAKRVEEMVDRVLGSL